MTDLRTKIASAIAQFWAATDTPEDAADAVLVAIASDPDRIEGDAFRAGEIAALDRATIVLPFPIDPYGGFDHESLRAAQVQHTNALRDMAEELRREAAQ